MVGDPFFDKRTDKVDMTGGSNGEFFQKTVEDFFYFFFFVRLKEVEMTYFAGKLFTASPRKREINTRIAADRFQVFEKAFQCIRSAVPVTFLVRGCFQFIAGKGGCLKAF